MKAAIRQRNPVTVQSRSGVFVVAVGLVGILGVTSSVPVFAGENEPVPMLMVQVYNYSQASPAVLTGAEREAGRILGEAGLRAVWLECPVGPSSVMPKGPCDKELEATDVRLRVLLRPPSMSTRTAYSALPFIPLSPVSITSMLCVAPRLTVPSRRSRSFWVASSLTNSAISCLVRTAIPARELCSRGGSPIRSSSS